MPQPSSKYPQVSNWLEHVRVLSVDIGARGSTREGERKGAEYAQAQFQKIGLKPIWETFQSALSIFHPHKLSDVIGGCLKHGLSLTHFEEYAHDLSMVYAAFENFEKKPPLSYSLVARKII